MIDQALQLVVVLSSSVVLFLAEPACDRMSPCTPLIVRISFHFLAVGAAANLVWILMLDDKPNWPEAIIVAGIALMLVCDRLRPRSAADRRRTPQIIDQLSAEDTQ